MNHPPLLPAPIPGASSPSASAVPIVTLAMARYVLRGRFFDPTIRALADLPPHVWNLRNADGTVVASSSVSDGSGICAFFHAPVNGEPLDLHLVPTPAPPTPFDAGAFRAAFD